MPKQEFGHEGIHSSEAGAILGVYGLSAGGGVGRRDGEQAGADGAKKEETSERELFVHGNCGLAGAPWRWVEYKSPG